MVMSCSKLTEYDAESIIYNLINKTLADISVLQCNSGTRGVLEGDRAQHGTLVVLWQSQQWGAGSELGSVTTTQADSAPPFIPASARVELRCYTAHCGLPPGRILWV